VQQTEQRLIPNYVRQRGDVPEPSNNADVDGMRTQDEMECVKRPTPS
jgi:hypothetical protein